MTVHPDDRDRVVDLFGVGVMQVERDHLISVLLSTLSTHFAERILFFGGTALNRTHLPYGRLSEDIDLIAFGDRRPLVADFTGSPPHAAPREFGVLSWDPPLDPRSDRSSGTTRTLDGIAVRIQLLSGDGSPAWPTERCGLHERYRDVASAELIVPTRPAFVAWKTMAWHDRHASRDLWDLSVLAEQDAFDESAVQLLVDNGPTGKAPSPWMFNSAPSVAEWHSQLSGQTRLRVEPVEARDRVRAAWTSAVD